MSIHNVYDDDDHDNDDDEEMTTTTNVYRNKFKLNFTKRKWEFLMEL